MSESAPRESDPHAEFLALPDHVVGQIINGELIVSPRPRSTHAGASSGLGVVIGAAFRYGIGGPGGWLMLDEPELHLRRDIVVPDLAGWRRARMPELPDEAYFELPPDWICEVLSPSTASIDRIRKMDLYAREGVGHAWLLDVDAKTLEVFELREGLWLRIAAHADDETVRVPPFDAIELPLALLWQR